VGRIGAAVRLGEAEAADELSAGHARKILLLLLLGAEGMNRVHAERGLHRDEAADAGVAALELLTDQAVADGVEAGAAVALERRAEEAEAGELRNQVSREVVLLETLLDDGQHFVVDEPRDGLLHHALLFTERAGDVVEIQWIQGHGNSDFSWMLLLRQDTASQAQGCARPPQVAGSRAKTTFLPETRWAGQEPGSSAYFKG